MQTCHLKKNGYQQVIFITICTTHVLGDFNFGGFQLMQLIKTAETFLLIANNMALKKLIRCEQEM